MSQSKEQILWGEEVYSDIMRLEYLLNTGILSAPFHNCDDFKQSVFIEVLILLNDLLQKAYKKGLRVNFTDDVQTSSLIKDVTDLINVVRNAACHIPSETRYAMGDRFMLVTVNFQSLGMTIKSEDSEIVFPLECEYNDDTAFFFVSHRIYLNRHLWQAFNEVSALLKPLTHYSENAWVRNTPPATPEEP